MGFKLRSGNGPLPFKQMGATPVKSNGLGSVLSGLAGGLTTKKDNELDLKSANELGSTVEGMSAKATRGPDVEMIKLPKSSKTTTDGPIKPSKSFEEVSTETKRRKAVADKEDTIFNDAKDDGTVVSRGAKKVGSWINKMAEKRAKFQASEEGARFRDDMNRSANIIAGDNRYATDNEAKFKSEKRTSAGEKRASELHKVKMENVKRDQLETDQMNEMRGFKLQAYKDAMTNEFELPSTSTDHVDVNGNPVFVPQSKLRQNKPFGTDINQY